MTLSSHYYIIAVPWIPYRHMFKRRTLTALEKLHTNVSYLHSLQWFSRVMSDGLSMERKWKSAPSFIPVHVGKKVIQYSNCCYSTLYHYVNSCHCYSILYIYTVLILDGTLWQDVLYYQYVIYFVSSHFLWMRKEMHLVQAVNSRSYIQTPE